MPWPVNMDWRYILGTFLIGIVCGAGLIMVAHDIDFGGPFQVRQTALWFEQIGPDEWQWCYVDYSLYARFHIDQYRVMVHKKGGSIFYHGGWSSVEFKNIPEGTVLNMSLYLAIEFNETYAGQLWVQNETAFYDYLNNRSFHTSIQFLALVGTDHNLTADTPYGTYGYCVQVREMGTEWWNRGSWEVQ